MSGVLSSEQLLRRIEWISTGFLVAATLAAWGFFSGGAAVSVLLGGLIAASSFQTLKWQTRRAFRNTERLPSKGGLLALYYLRYLATLFLIFLVIYYGWADPVALLVGLSVMVFGILVSGGIEYIKLLAEKGE